MLKGPDLKAKANITQAVGELIQIATNKSSAEDYGEKHGNKAKLVSMDFLVPSTSSLNEKREKNYTRYSINELSLFNAYKNYLRFPLL